MERRRQARAALFLAAATTACGPIAKSTGPTSMPVQEVRLDNGLQVELVPDQSATLATILVRYHVGAVDDPPKQEGVAHLVAHLTSAQHAGATSLATQLERVAIDLDIEPRATQTDFSERFAPEHLDAVIAIEAARMTLRCDRVDAAMFDAERGLVADELRANEAWQLRRAVDEAMYAPNDPYRRARAASAESAASITQQQACAFRERRYAPGNTIVVITGPVSADDLQRAIAPLSRVPARPFDPPASLPRFIPATSETRTIAARVSEPMIAVAWPLPTEPAERARARMLLRHAGSEVGGSELFDDDRVALTWIPLGEGKPEAKLAALAKAIDKSSEAFVQRSAPSLGGGRLGRVSGAGGAYSIGSGVRQPVSAWRARARQLAFDLAILDDPRQRAIHMASRRDFEKELTATTYFVLKDLEHTLAFSVEPEHPVSVLVQPDGVHSLERASLALTEHGLHRALELDPASADVPPQVPASPLAHAKQLQLANGLRVILAPTSSAPLVHAMLVFGAGNAAGASPRAGSAAVLALRDVLRQRAKDGAFSMRWDVDVDTGALSISEPTLLIEHRLAWFAGLATAEQPFEGAAHHALGELPPAPHNWRTADVLFARVFGAHPYGRVMIGAPPTAEDAVAFYRAFLHPHDATLVITGGFDPVWLEPIVRRVFEPWQGNGRAPDLGAVTRGKGAAIASTKDSARVELDVAWLGGPHDDDQAARDIIATMLGRLSLHTYGAYSTMRFVGSYWLSGGFDPDRASDEIAGLRDAVAALGDGSAPSRQLFAAARRSVVVRYAAGGRTSLAWAGDLANRAAFDHDLAWRQAAADRATKVTYEDVQRLLGAELTPDSAVWYIRGPAEPVQKVFARLGMTPEQLRE